LDKPKRNITLTNKPQGVYTPCLWVGNGGWLEVPPMAREPPPKLPATNYHATFKMGVAFFMQSTVPKTLPVPQESPVYAGLGRWDGIFLYIPPCEKGAKFYER
jgi:hypothetical protein